jgi:hypothetical protein
MVIEMLPSAYYSALIGIAVSTLIRILRLTIVTNLYWVPMMARLVSLCYLNWREFWQ